MICYTCKGSISSSRRRNAQEESPGSKGQDAGENPAGANSGKVPQKYTARNAGKGEKAG